MRRGWVVSGVALLAALGSSVRAEYDGIVIVDQVEVRSGPSPAYYPTSLVRRGTRVTVVSDALQNGSYLAIKPPLDSFSWIRRSDLGPPTGQKAAVLQNTRIRVGSHLDGRPPIVEWFEVPKGTPVTLLNMPGASDQQGAWLPIATVANEVRYVPASAVQKTQPVQTTVGASPAANPAFAPLPAGTPSVAPSQQLLAQAPAAAGPPPDVRLAPTAPGAVAPSSWSTPGQPAWAPPAQTWNTIPQQAATSQYTYTPDSQVHVAQAQPQSYAPAQPQRYNTPVYQPPTAYRVPPAAPQPAAAATPAEQMVGPGWLRKAGRTLEERPTYVMETMQGYPLIYVHAAPGLDLDPFVGKRVNLAGPVFYRGDLRTWYITVNSVTIPR